MISLLTVIFLVVTVMLWFDERGKDTDGGNYTSWSTPNFPTSSGLPPYRLALFGLYRSYRLRDLEWLAECLGSLGVVLVPTAPV